MAEDPAPDLHDSKESSSIDLIPLAVKILEVVLAVFAIGLVVDPYNSFQKIHCNKPQSKVNDIAVVFVTLGGYILINMVIIIGHLMGERLPKKMALMFTAIGGFLFIVAGSLIVHDWRKLRGSYVQISNNAVYPSKQYMDMMISASVFTFVDALVFIFDIFVTHQYT